MTFSPAELAACQRLVDSALEEDLSYKGDVTSQAIIAPGTTGRAELAARAEGVLAGLEAARLVFSAIDASVGFEACLTDGQELQPGTRLAHVSGSMRSILAGERTALNFVQHLSGVATRTRQFVDAVEGFSARIFDTRKTLPGWRILEKYAVRCGGGHNHRLGLYDGVLIKDNHLASLGGGAQAIRRALEAVRERVGISMPVIVEVDVLDQLEEALACGPDVVLLDNMSPEEMHEAVQRRNAVAPRILLEASGGVSLESVLAIAKAGVDRISVGALTHSAPALDIALDFVA